MRAFLTTILFCCIFAAVGCEAKLAPKRTARPLRPDSPVSVRIVGLTRVEPKQEGRYALEVFLEIRDLQGQQVQTEAKYLFELYKYTPRSSEPAGQRLQMWRVDGPEKGEWLDYLKAYQFELPLGGARPAVRDYLLRVTCFTPQQRRLTDTFRLENPAFTTQ